MNDINNNDISNNLSVQQSATVMATAPYYYDYYDIVSREDTIINKLESQYNLLNTGFTFISFILIIFLLYYLIKNMIRK